MEESTIYNLIVSKHLNQWKNDIENDRDFEYGIYENKLAEQIKTECGKELLTSFRAEVEARIDERNHQINIKLLNIGIQIGMELQLSLIKNNE